MGDWWGVDGVDRKGCKHDWQVVGVSFRLPDVERPGGAGSYTEYRCGRCPEVLMVGPGGVHPI